MTDVDKNQGPIHVAPYSILAAGYDVVMEHVAYGEWAEYVHNIIHANRPGAHLILELGCGTGSLALELQQMGSYLYLGSDKSSQMIQVARRKVEKANIAIRFEVADFTNFRIDTPVDVVLLLYDGLNYLLEKSQIVSLMRCVYQALKPGGLFIVDQSTPINSKNNEAFFEDVGKVEDFEFVRYSIYDDQTQLHTTTLDLTVGKLRFQEQHIQRAYDLNEIRQIFRDTGYEEMAAYDGFSLHTATEASERVHWVLNRPFKIPEV